MGQLDKQKALTTILTCAKLYEQNLCNKDFLYIIRGEKSKPFYIEVTYQPVNFQHLMGVVTDIKPAVFYQDCLDGKLSLNNFRLRSDGATLQKSQVSTALMSIHKRASVYGESVELFTDVLIGNVRGCMGFRKPDKSRFYVPNSLLEADVRKKAVPNYPILAVYQKNMNDELYSTVCYKSKILNDITPENLKWPKDIQNKISGESLIIDL